MAKSKKRAKSKIKNSSSSKRKPAQKTAQSHMRAKTPKKVDAFDLNVKPLKAVKAEKKDGKGKSRALRSENLKLTEFKFKFPNINLKRFKKMFQAKDGSSAEDRKIGFHKYKAPIIETDAKEESNLDESAFRRGLDNIPEMMFAIISFFFIPIGIIFSILFFKNHKLKFIYSLAGVVVGMGTILLIYKATLKVIPLVQKLLN